MASGEWTFRIKWLKFAKKGMFLHCPYPKPHTPYPSAQISDCYITLMLIANPIYDHYVEETFGEERRKLAEKDIKLAEQTAELAELRKKLEKYEQG